MSTKDDDDNDDLYDDMDNVKLASAAAPSESLFKKKSSKVAPKSLTEENAELQSTVEQLQRENETLKRNMGTLYRTAIQELARKDRQIQALQTELDAATNDTGRLKE